MPDALLEKDINIDRKKKANFSITGNDLALMRDEAEYDDFKLGKLSKQGQHDTGSHC